MLLNFGSVKCCVKGLIYYYLAPLSKYLGVSIMDLPTVMVEPGTDGEEDGKMPNTKIDVKKECLECIQKIGHTDGKRSVEQ